MARAIVANLHRNVADWELKLIGACAAEVVASNVVRDIREYLASRAPVGTHLADQLLLPIAMSGKGCFATMPPSRHTLTNIDVIKKFLLVSLTVAKHSSAREVTCS